MKMLRLVLLSLVSVAALTLSAVTRYATAQNRFHTLELLPSPHVSVDKSGDRYVADNGNSQPVFVTSSTLLPSQHFRVQIRLANKHNAPRSSYSVREVLDDGSEERRRIDHPQWGVAFSPTDDDSDTYWALMAECGNSSINDDINDRRSMTVSLAKVTAGRETILASRQLTSGVNLYSDLNTFQIEVREGELSAWAGDTELQPLFTVPFAIASPTVHAGCHVGAGAKVEIERCVVSFDEHTTPTATRHWTIDSLDAHFAESIDPVEGYWRYQDRDVDDRWMRLGGRYTVAVVREGESYEIIYLSGAETHRSQWTPGMLKGRFTPTIFSDHYDLMWIDATGDPITQDAYAAIENGVLLSLQFPVYKSQMRFSKILHP